MADETITKRNFRCPDVDWEELDKSVEFFDFENKSQLILHLIKRVNRKRRELEKRNMQLNSQFDDLVDK